MNDIIVSADVADARAHTHACAHTQYAHTLGPISHSLKHFTSGETHEGNANMGSGIFV